MTQTPADAAAEQFRKRRLRDFFVLTCGAIGVLGLLFLTGAVGLVELITGGIVMSAGAMAYFIGSLPSSTTAIKAPILESPPLPAPAAVDPQAMISFIASFPLPVLLTGKSRRIEMSNALARNILRLQSDAPALLSSSLRHPELLTAIDRVVGNGASEVVEFTLHGEAEVWLAHIQQGPKPQSALIVFEDLTAVRRAERARADFLANASHELRTPLTAIGGFIETMRGPARNDKAAWDGFLEIMFSQTERMKRLIADLLSLSRIEFSEHRAPDTRVEVSAIAHAAAKALEPLADEAGVRLHFSAPGGTNHAIADADELTQVVQNLASNAIKYAPPGGEVQILLGVADTMSIAAEQCARQIANAKRAILLSPYASSEVPALWLRVTNTGEGIPEQHLPRLGERFYRVDESRGGSIEGTGLGLAIVKHIMARHRGGLAVESGEGLGTAFGVWMPRSVNDAT